MFGLMPFEELIENNNTVSIERTGKMKQLMILVAAVMLAVPVMADTFGTGANQFTIVFVPISANPGETRSTNTCGGFVSTNTNGTHGPWIDPGYNYRMGKFEITNAQFA